MAKVRVGATTTKGIYRNIVLDIGKKVKIGIGYVNDQRRLQGYLQTMEMLETSIIRGDEPSLDLWGRINKLPTGIQKKLIKNHLIVPQDGCPSLAQIVDEYYDDCLKRIDPRSSRNYKNTLKKGLLTYIDSQLAIDQVDADQLIEFINASATTYKNSTVANQIKRAKALFRFAIDQEYISANPFETKRLRELCSLFTVELEPERVEKQQKYMTEDEVDRLLRCKKSDRNEIENKEWNALIYLCRFGGGRVSSYLVLRWEDINFDAAIPTIRLRMKQTSKGKFVKGDKKVEFVPLFAELEEVLLDLKKSQPEGTKYVLNKIGRLEKKPEFETTNVKGERIKQGRWETNLGTTFKKILKRNGFKVWPQPFHAFRSYRGAELGRLGASNLQLDAWIGNTAEVRKRHYGKFHLIGAEKFTSQKGGAA